MEKQKQMQSPNTDPLTGVEELAVFWKIGDMGYYSLRRKQISQPLSCSINIQIYVSFITDMQ